MLTVRWPSDGRRRLSTQYRAYDWNDSCTADRIRQLDHVGLTRRRCRSIISRRSRFETFAPNAIGLATLLATNPGMARAISDPVR